MPLPGGDDHVRINLLRTVAWLEEQETWLGQAGHQRVLEAKARDIAVGRYAYTVLPEMGIAGWAKVVAVGPCPAIEAGEGRIITATFRTPNRPLVEIRIVGVPNAVRCTSGHPFLSLDRGGFVHAADLKPGERLHGTARRSSLVRSRVGHVG